MVSRREGGLDDEPSSVEVNENGDFLAGGYGFREVEPGGEI